jgi:hypothetical protein
VTSCQGDEDEIVPPEQSELMWQAIKDKGLPTTLMMYKVWAWRARRAQLSLYITAEDAYAAPPIALS